MHGQSRLSDAAQISLLTGTPFEDEVFTIYGHSSIRVVDPAHNLDLLFNYGHFNSAQPHFIYHFVKGETDYKLAAYPTSYYLAEAAMNGIGILEQVLNLTDDEKQTMWEALVKNAQPENAIYRYNVFYDNCATRPAEIIERFVDGKIAYNFPEMHVSFRDLINECAHNLPWLIFGTDLVLGAPTDKEINPRETFFLPAFLHDALDAAVIVEPDGTKRPVIVQSFVLAEKNREEEPAGIFTPLLCFILLFILIAGLSFLEWKKKAYFRWLDILLFGVAGIAGCIVFFISFVSVHPCTWPNWNIVWLHPFHLVAIVLFLVKKLNKVALSYHFINFAALTLFVLAWSLLPQHMNTAALFLVLSLWLRSGMAIYRWKFKNK